MLLRQEVLKPLMPYHWQETKKLKKETALIAHYTSADVALKILINGELWLSEVKSMNDTGEILFGLEEIVHALTSMPGCDALGKTLGGSLSTLHEELPSLFSDLQGKSRISCLSRHSGEREQKLGRLSMWRAYAAKNGVALMFRPEALGRDHPRQVFASHVLYGDRHDVDSQLHQIAKNIQSNDELFLPLKYDQLRAHVLWALYFAVISLKHPAFKEENEIRLIVDSRDIKSGQYEELRSMAHPARKGEQVCVAKLGTDLVGGSDEFFREYLDRILIGPSQDAEATRALFVNLLRKMGITDAESRVMTTNIPLRT